MPLVPTCLHAFQIAFGKAQSICFPTLHQHVWQSEQRLPTVGLCFVQNFLLAYQKFNANSTCFGHIQATKGGGSGRGGEKGFHSSPYTHLQTKKCLGRICASWKPGCIPVPLNSRTNLLQHANIMQQKLDKQLLIHCTNFKTHKFSFQTHPTGQREVCLRFITSSRLVANLYENRYGGSCKQLSSDTL